MRNVLAVVLGLIVAGLVMTGLESLGHALYPPPAWLSADDPKSIERYLKDAPFLAVALILVGWAAASFLGGATAARVAVGRRTGRYGLFIGVFLLVGAAGTMWMIPHPTWFMLIAPFACLVPGMVGGAMGCQRRR